MAFPVVSRVSQDLAFWFRVKGPREPSQAGVWKKADGAQYAEVGSSQKPRTMEGLTKVVCLTAQRIGSQ